MTEEAKTLDLPTEVVDDLPGWKRRYGKVHLLPLQDRLFVFRGLSFAEIDDYNSTVKHDGEKAEAAALEAAILYPRPLNLEGFEAWLGDRILQKILSTTGLGDPDLFLQSLEDQRKEAQTVAGMSVAYVAHAFHMHPDEVRALPISKLTQLLAMSEVVLGRQMQIGDKPDRPPHTRFASSGDRQKRTRELMQARQRGERATQRPEVKPQGQTLGSVRGGIPGISAPMPGVPGDQKIDFGGDAQALGSFGY